MSETYRGVADNVSIPSSVAIASSTNASPIAVTCGGAHGLMTGDRVYITDHATNTAANGAWTVTKTSSTSFTLNGTTGNGAGGATGHVFPFNFNNGATLPDDGDDADGSSFNPPHESSLDRHAWLVERTGYMRLVAFDTVNQLQATPNDPWGSSYSAAAGSYAYEPNIHGTLLGGSAWKCLPSDRLEVEITGSVQVGGNPCFLAIGAYVAEFGAAEVPGSAVQLGAGATFAPVSSAQSVVVSACGIPSMPRASKVFLYLLAQGSGGGSSLFWFGDFSVHVKQWRFN